MAMISTKLVSLAILCVLLVPNSRSASRAARILNDGSGSLGGVGGSLPRQAGSHFGQSSPSGTTTGGGKSFLTAGAMTRDRAGCGRDKPGSRYYSCRGAGGGNP